MQTALLTSAVPVARGSVAVTRPKPAALAPAPVLGRAVRQAARSASAITQSPVVVRAVAEPAPSTESKNGGCVTFTVAPGENGTLVITVLADAALTGAAYKKVLKEVSKSAQSPGFRQKKKGSKKSQAVPESLLIAEAGGMDRIKGACVEEIMMRTMGDALEEVADKAYADSERIVTPQAELLANFSKDAPFSYQLAVNVPPTVSFSGDYKGLDITLSKPASEEELNAELEQELREIRKGRGNLEVAEDKAIQSGDTLIIDLRATRLDQNAPIEGMARDGFKVDLDQRDTFPAEFVEGLLSMTIGEEKAIPLTFADDWEPATLAGVPARFDVTLKEVFRWTLPELDDDLVKTVDPELESVAHLKEALMTAAKVQQEMNKEMELSNAVMEALADIVDMHVPDFVMQSIGSQQYQAKLLEAQQKGLLNYDAMQQLLTDSAINSYIADNQEEMLRIAKSTSAVEHIFHAENIEVAEEKIQAELQSSISEFEAQGMEYDEARLREQVEEMTKGSAVMEFLMDSANVTYAEN